MAGFPVSFPIDSTFAFVKRVGRVTKHAEKNHLVELLETISITAKEDMSKLLNLIGEYEGIYASELVGEF